MKFNIEQQRAALQGRLDALKTSRERNELGQFATPYDLAIQIVKVARRFLPPRSPVKFIDPAFGTGVFYSALLNEFGKPSSAISYEIDKHYAAPTTALWADYQIDINHADFLADRSQANYNLLICNPPYVRHHHIASHQKQLLAKAVASAFGIKISQLSGLYCYFLIFGSQKLEEDGIAAFIVPSEFLDVNYGSAVKDFLKNRVSLLRIHRFESSNVQFSDALVSSSVVFYRKASPNPDSEVEFSAGNSLLTPDLSFKLRHRTLDISARWSKYFREPKPETIPKLTLGDLFDVKRGIATGDNKFFIVGPEEVKTLNIPKRFLRRILPSPRDLSTTVLQLDQFKINTKELFLINCTLKEEELRSNSPALFEYLSKGTNARNSYLCRNRSPWYLQEMRSPALFYVNYIGRTKKSGSNPFRFILNLTDAIVTNSYLMLYPKPWLQKCIVTNDISVFTLHDALNQSHETFFENHSRSYGGGMHKFEPQELKSLPIAAPELETLHSISRSQNSQITLLEPTPHYA